MPRDQGGINAPSPSGGVPAEGGGYWVQVPIDPTAPRGGGGTTGTTGGTGTPPPTPTGNAALDSLLQALSYGNGVYQNLPVLQYLMGNLSEGQYNGTSTTDTTVPQLGITLPGPGKLNYQMLSNIRQNSPSSFELLKSLFAAGNRDLESEMNTVRQAAPLGSAYQSSLIQT